MPIIAPDFNPPRIIRNTHLQTIIPALLRGSSAIDFERTRLELVDGDFIDLDCSLHGGKTLAIISHGLEGSTLSPYVQGIAAKLSEYGIDSIAWNMRGCSGEINRLLPSYHSGYTSDLDRVVQYAIDQYNYSEIFLIGFSVGGNVTLKYLGEQGRSISSLIKGAICISVPIDLASSAAQLAKSENRIYMNVFLRNLFAKLRQKKKLFPDLINLDGIDQIRTFAEYDARFIAPLFGFKSAEDYWQKASSLPFLSEIAVPTLLLSSADDTFLGSPSFPQAVARTSRNFHLEITHFGGHVGFMYSNPWGVYYSEIRALEFIYLISKNPNLPRMEGA